jgi:hypothetical protein
VFGAWTLRAALGTALIAVSGLLLPHALSGAALIAFQQAAFFMKIALRGSWLISQLPPAMPTSRQLDLDRPAQADVPYVPSHDQVS